MKQFYPQNLYKLLNNDISIPYALVQFLFFFCLIQFFSLNMDSDLWPDPNILKTPLIFAIVQSISFCRIYPMLEVFQLLGNFENVMLIVVFCFVFCFSCLKMYIAVSFTNKMKSLVKERLELEWETVLHYKTNELGSEILKIYNIFFPIIFAPIFEIAASPVFTFLNSSQASQIWAVIMGTITMLLLFVHMFLNVFYFNQFEFNKQNSLTRTIALTDILNPLAQISPIIVHVFVQMQQKIIFSILVQIFLLLILLYSFLMKHSYFDVKVMHLWGVFIIFKIMFLSMLLFSVLDKRVELQPVFFVVSVVFFYKVAQSLSSMHILAILKDTRCNNIRWINEMTSRSGKTSFKMNYISQKFLILYGFLFYYAPDNLDDYDWLKQIPLEIIGFISNHIRQCNTFGCPLQINNITKIIKYSEEKKYFPLFDNPNLIKKLFREYTLFLFGSIPTFVLANDLGFWMNYLLLLLTDDSKTFSAIQQIHKLKDSQGLSFYQRYYLDHFLEIILKNLKKFEESQRELKQMNSNKCLTNFNTKIYIDIENSYMKITSKINKYMTSYIKFIENLMAEKPHLQNISQLGHYLLKLQDKLDSIYLRAGKTPRIIVQYLEYKQVFCEDDRITISSLTKLYNYMIDLQMMHSNEENKNLQVFDENLFFSDNSCFMHVSGSFETLGKILKVDENTKNAFGYQSVSAMQGQNITFIIPKIVGLKHDGFMRRFLKTGKTDFLFKEQFLFARRCNNDIFKVFLTIKTFFDKSSQMLRFLTHLKPNFNHPDSSLILVNEFGHIDSYGGPIKELLEPLLEEYKSNFYIQVLIPQLEQYFNACVEKHFNPNEKKASSDNWKHKYKTRLGSSEWNNDILNLRIYDKYPCFPQVLEIKDFDPLTYMKDLDNAKSYFSKLLSIMRKHYSGCNIYRFECIIEDFKYEGLSFKLFNVQKIRFLYYRSAEEIKKIDSKNVQALFILPKIMLQTGLFRRLISKRSKNDDYGSCSMLSVQNQKVWDYKTVLEMEKLEQKKQCSIFEIKDILLRDESKSQYLQELFQRKGIRHCLSCIEFGRQLNVLEISNENEKSEGKEVFDKRSAMKERSKTSAVPKKNSNHNEKFLIPNFPEKKPKTPNVLEIPSLGLVDNKITPIQLENDGMDQSQIMRIQVKASNQLEVKVNKSQENFIKKDSVINESNFKSMNPAKQKYFTENKRLIYKMDSLDPMEVALEDQMGLRINPKRGMTGKDKRLSSNSSVQRENFERRSDLFSLINKPFIPRSYQYMRYGQAFLIIITLLSFSLLAYFSNDILLKVTDALNRNTFIEMFKTKILNCLILAQESVIFSNPEDTNYLLIEAQSLGSKMITVLNPPIDQLNQLNYDFSYTSTKTTEMSLIASLFSLTDYFLMNPKDDEVNQIILSNSLNIFQKLENTSNMMQITSSMLNDLQKKLFILAFLSMATIALIVTLQIMNVFSAFGYMNNILKLFLSLSINDYKNLMEKIIKFKDYKTSQESSTMPNRSKNLGFLRLQADKTQVKENLHNKKSVRLVAVQIKIPVLFVMLVGLLYIATFCSFVVAILYETQMLDNSLSDLLEKISTVTKTKSYNFQIFIRVTDKKFFNNSYGFSDEENQQMLNSQQSFITYAFDDSNKFPDYDHLMTSSLCNSSLPQNVFSLCSRIGDGVLSKGKTYFFFLRSMFFLKKKTVFFFIGFIVIIKLNGNGKKLNKWEC